MARTKCPSCGGKLKLVDDNVELRGGGKQKLYACRECGQTILVKKEPYESPSTRRARLERETRQVKRWTNKLRTSD